MYGIMYAIAMLMPEEHVSWPAIGSRVHKFKNSVTPYNVK